MVDLHFWLLFLSAVLVLNITPGPDLLYILTKTISGGRKVGWAAAMGVCTGALVHAVIAAIGLSAILMSSAVAFNIVKYAGVAYLLYLAWKSFRSSGTQLIVTPKQKEKKIFAWDAFKQGMLIDVLNPKVALFFMSFLPQFVRDGHGSTSWQLIYLGLLVVAIAAAIQTIFVLIADKLLAHVSQNKSFGVWLDRMVGGVFVALGIKLAFADNR